MPIVTFTLALAGAFASLAVARGLFDPDFFWHLATGRLIVETGALPTTDPFSFTWYGEPWVPDQWLAEVLLHLSMRGMGEMGTLALFGVLAALAVGIMAWSAQRLGSRTAVAVAVGLLAAVAVLPQVTARPQVIGLVFLALELAVLAAARPSAPRLLLTLPPLFLVWANVHGSYVVGLGIGFVYLLATVAGRTPMSSRRAWVVGTGLAAVAACALTPSGSAGLLYALSFADTGDWGARNIAEWQSPNFHDPQLLAFLALIVGLLAVGVRAAPGWLAVVALAGVALGLMAVRGVGMASLMIAPALAVGLEARLAALRVRAPGRGDPPRRTLELVVAGLGAAVLLVATFAGGPRGPARHALPVAGTEHLRAVAPDARVLARYGWGGYVLNELYTGGGRVFVDGRMHKYAPAVLADYDVVAGAEAGWEEVVERHGVEALLLRVDAPLVRGIAQAGGWCEAFRDELQVLLLRRCDATTEGSQSGW